VRRRQPTPSTDLIEASQDRFAGERSEELRITLVKGIAWALRRNGVKIETSDRLRFLSVVGRTTRLRGQGNASNGTYLDASSMRHV
jgi:hypothetical protein